MKKNFKIDKEYHFPDSNLLKRNQEIIDSIKEARKHYFILQSEDESKRLLKSTGNNPEIIKAVEAARKYYDLPELDTNNLSPQPQNNTQDLQQEIHAQIAPNSPESKKMPQTNKSFTKNIRSEGPKSPKAHAKNTKRIRYL